MNQKIWQRLLSLETRDVTQQRFKSIHERTLNARRAREINASAKQAREYFTNASNCNHSVRPLLAFYGVICLSRALLLLLRREGGEEVLTSGHGIETLDWGSVMAGKTAHGLRRLGDLRIRTCSGLFSDFVASTQNRMAIHVQSAGVDWRIYYDVPDQRQEISVGDLFSRIPDLRRDYAVVSSHSRFTPVSEMTYSSDDGFRAKVKYDNFDKFEDVYKTSGYEISVDGEYCVLTCREETLERSKPQFVHSYLNKVFGVIPNLHIAEPFPGSSRYSQLCITYLVSYVLGMLVRYYPTHWIALVQGEHGDAIWPTVNLANQLVEESFPELVAEMIDDAIAHGHPV